MSLGRVLVVDDDPQNILLAKTVINWMGCDVETAGNGAECLEQVQQSPPDLILLDVMMPDIDGFQVCRRLKDDKDFRHIPIVLLTALDSSQDRVAGAEAGADDFISKPFNRQELTARVKSLLRVKRLHDQEVEYLREVARLTTAAAAVEEGSFDAESLDGVADRDDELGQLARVFQKMAREVQARERALQEQLDRLRIEIDTKRRNQEVSKITESDYFQRLRERALEMRADVGGSHN